MAIDCRKPPTRPGLMLTIRPEPRAIMSAARSTLVIDSSRQIGVFRRFWSSAWRGQVVPGERLLDHHQLELVERHQAVRVSRV